MSALASYDEHPAVEAVWAARREVQRAASAPRATWSVDDLTDTLVQLATLESQTSALRLSVLAELDRRKVALGLGATGTDAWASQLTAETRAVVAHELWLAERLDEVYHCTRDALAAGRINEDQAKVIVRAADTVPASVTAEQRREAEEALVAKAGGGLDARGLHRAARRMLEVVSREAADRHEGDQLVIEERRAERETFLTLVDNEDGTVSGRFTIPALHGAMLRAALEHLGSPRRLAKNRAGELVHDATVSATTGGEVLSWTERLGLGFTELIEHLPTEASGGFSHVGATVLVHLELAHLLDGLGAARLDTGDRISAGEARRLACGAGLVPAVLGGASVPLDLGRVRRLHTGHQRRALSMRHETCAAEGCERPFAWCDVHHRRPWSQDGPTTLENGVPLCGFHHRRAHDARFGTADLPSGEIRFRRLRT